MFIKEFEDLIIKDKNDLIKKIEKGIQDIEKCNVCSIDEAFSEIAKLLN